MPITRPIDFTGCNPEIKQAILDGNAITCYVSDFNVPSRKVKDRCADIVAYVNVEDVMSYIDSDGNCWLRATPAEEPTEWIMPPERAIPILIKEGWYFGEGGVVLMGSYSARLSHRCFKFFGCKLSEAPSDFSIKELRCIIEEI